MPTASRLNAKRSKKAPEPGEVCTPAARRRRRLDLDRGRIRTVRGRQSPAGEHFPATRIALKGLHLEALTNGKIDEN